MVRTGRLQPIQCLCRVFAIIGGGNKVQVKAVRDMLAIRFRLQVMQLGQGGGARPPRALPS